MPDVQWNRATWDQNYQWNRQGDEWSVAWGGVRSQWLGTLYPRISSFVPAGRILEIAPGHGRWTQFLLQHCVEYFGVDLSQTCVDICRRRFAAFNRAQFLTNDGISLRMIPDNSIDFVFSFDSLVHVEVDVVREYIWQTLQKLTPTGVAFLHHSNGKSAVVNLDDVRKQNRAQSVSSSIVKELIEDCSGKPLIQEEITWSGPSRMDCITTFCRKGAFEQCSYRLLENDEFVTEMDLVRRYQSPYAVR